MQEFQAAKKESSGLLTKMAYSFHNMSASYMMKNRSAEFVVMNEYINTFAEKIGVLDRISQRIVKEQYGKEIIHETDKHANCLVSTPKLWLSSVMIVFLCKFPFHFIFVLDFLTELNEWGPIFTLWSNLEDKVSLALGAIAKAVEKNFLALQELVSPFIY